MKSYRLLFSIIIAVLVLVAVFASQSQKKSEGRSEVNMPKGTTDRTSVPEGYTLDSYTIEKVTENSCQVNSDCETPMEYLAQSRCPFTSICLENKCAIVCPDVKMMEVEGEIVKVKPEMDGSILTLNNGEFEYEVLVSIPNLGEKFANAVSDIEIGKRIRVIGSELKLPDQVRIIAAEIYVE